MFTITVRTLVFNEKKKNSSISNLSGGTAYLYDDDKRWGPKPEPWHENDQLENEK